jgi:hypothetical protein
MAFGTRIAHSYNLAEMVAMRSLCEEVDIFVYDIDFSAQVSLAGADIGFYLEVRRLDADRARAVLLASDYAQQLLRE